jgi:uncharacterized protein YpuA (DUF1002 family)
MKIHHYLLNNNQKSIENLPEIKNLSLDDKKKFIKKIIQAFKSIKDNRDYGEFLKKIMKRKEMFEEKLSIFNNIPIENAITQITDFLKSISNTSKIQN